MNKYLILVLFLIFTSFSVVFAFEDCMIFSDGKMTNISIQDHNIIDVYPLITVMNKKNTLIVHPLKNGKTTFSILKDDRDKYVFNVSINKTGTTIDSVDGFEICTLDEPPQDDGFDLDLPPLKMGGQ